MLEAAIGGVHHRVLKNRQHVYSFFTIFLQVVRAFSR